MPFLVGIERHVAAWAFKHHSEHVNSSAAQALLVSHCCGLLHASFWQVDKGVLLHGHHMLLLLVGRHQQMQLHEQGVARVHTCSKQALAAHWLACIAGRQQDESVEALGRPEVHL